MAAVQLTPDDLAPFATIEVEKAGAMIEDALALAARVAPCILEDDFTQGAAAKAILRGAVLRWNESGAGAVQYQTAGPFSQSLDTRHPRRAMFWPSEIADLQRLCADTSAPTAFDIDTVPTAGPLVHSDICALNFGADYCSCGAVLTGLLPLYGS